MSNNNSSNKDKYGLSTCIGETFTGLPYPVFYDPHYPIRIKKPPGTLITGAPGSGKTFLGLLIASHSSILGKSGFIIDPKGDFNILKNLEHKGYINKVRLWKLMDDFGGALDENTGVLDPTLFYDKPSDNSALTIDIVKILAGGEITHKQSTMLTPIVSDVTSGNMPSFDKVVGKLLSNRDDEIRALGYTLETILSTSLAKLLVANKRIKRQPLHIGNELVVANLKGITLPADTKPIKDYNTKEKLSITILSLIMTLVMDNMRNSDSSVYKTLIIDEAWAIIATKLGLNMIQEALRIGRSKNLATILLTQSGKHLGTEEQTDLNTMISVRFAFNNNDEIDNETTVKLMQLPKGEGWEQTIRNLTTGQCLLQNAFFETSFVHIMAEDDWVEMFNTTPIQDNA